MAIPDFFRKALNFSSHRKRQKPQQDENLLWILSRLIWASWGLFVFVLLSSVIFKDRALFAVTLSGGVVLILPLILSIRGYLQASGLILVGLAISIITLIASVGQGIRDLAIVTFPIVLIFAGLTLDRVMFKVSVVLTLVATCWLVLGETFGWFSTKPFNEKGSNWFYLIGVATIVLVAALAVDLFSTNIRKGQELVRKSEARYRRIVETTNEGVIVLDRDIRMTLVNKRVASMLGYTIEELLGRKLESLFFEEDLANHRAQMQERSLGQSSEYERCFRRKDGGRVWTIISATATTGVDGQFDGAFGMITDITKRKLTEQALTASEVKYRSLFEQASDGILYLSTNFRILAVNESFARMHGYSVEEMQGIDLRDLDSPESARMIPDRMRPVFSGEHIQFEVEHYHKDGHLFPLSVSTGLVSTTEGQHILAFHRDITERVQVEKSLRENQELQSLFVRHSPIFTYIKEVTSTEDRLLQASDNLYELVGVPSTEILIGKTMEELFPAEFAAKISADDRAVVVKGEVLKLDEDLNGRHYTTIKFPLVMGERTLLAGYTLDITERKEAEAVMRESESRFRAFVEQSPVAIGVFSLDGIGMYANQKYVETLGMRSVEELIGRPASEMFAPQFREDSKERTRRRLLGLPVPPQYESVLVHPDGSEFPVQVAVASIQLPGGPASIAFLTDLTERKRAEEDRIARELAERANRAKSDFISRMSHELRTPLNAILGFAQLLERDELRPNQERSVSQINKSGRHLLTLVNQVLDIARIEAGKLHLSPEAVRLEAVVREAFELIRPLAEARGISLRLEADFSPGLFVMADHQSLRQVLLNLLSNAVKYNREGGEINVTTSLVGDGRLRLRIRDSGEGITQDKMERLFVPFERLGKETVEQEGTGLGLALSKGLVEAMGGRIGAESVPGEGSVFWLELELVAERQKEAIMAEVDEHLSDGMREGRGLVLYVEDNLANVQLVEAVIERLPGVTLITAMRGGLAMDLAKEHHPDLILLDLQLPDMHGSEVLGRLKADPATQKTPVIILSADALPEHMTDLLAQGANAYLTKPIDVKEFLKVVEKSLNERTDE